MAPKKPKAPAKPVKANKNSKSSKKTKTTKTVKPVQSAKSTPSTKPKKLGFDPLSWMNEHAGEEQIEPTVEQTKSAVNIKPEITTSNTHTEKASSTVAKNMHPLGLNVEVLESSFAAVAPQAEKLVELFYNKLFKEYPEVVPLFANTTQKKQEKMLLGALKLVIANLNNVDVLAEALTNLGAKHQGYGAVEAHYPVVRDTLLSALQEIAGEAWTNEIYSAWFDALNVVAKVMTDAYTENVVAIHAGGTDDEHAPVELEDDDYISPLGLDVQTLESSFALLAPQAEALVERFYDELFKRFPGVTPLFSNTSQKKQQTKLLGALKLVVANLRKPEILAPTLVEMGQRHQAYGAEPAHYEAVRDTLLDVMQEFAGSAWNYTIETAWRQALNLIAKVMTDAYTTTEDNTMSTNVSDMGSGLSSDEKAELIRLRSAVTGAMQPMMMIDRDFNITYANQATIDMLTKHEATIAAVYPGFKANAVMGACIDQFHKNPAHQRNMLSDPKNLPYTTDIQVGPLSFKLNVTAMVDGDGNYLGNTLEWSDITEELVKEDQAVKLQGAMDGSMQANIMVDRDLIITYANQATTDLLTKHKMVLQSIYPGFDPSKLIGTCIDTFHKDPAMQRRILSDPTNFPHQADIEIGALKFALNITAIMDSAGNYVGNSLEWSDVTELRERESNVARLQGTVDGAMTAIMMIDRDFIITYANQSTIEMLTKHEATLASVYPGFKASGALGSCIDIFHANPAHQRKMLDNPANLPYQTDIAVGPLKFSLNVTAIIDADNNYVGNALEWSDVTELRERESNVARLQGTVDGAMTAIMMIDRDFVITYANQSTIDMLTKHEATLASVYPGFKASGALGSCIDIFHANPAHQRKLLDDPANLPYQTDIAVGPLKFSLNVTAIIDAENNYVGNALEWADVTELRERESNVARLQGTIDGAMTAMMMIDREFVITYANQSTVDLLTKHEATLASVYPGFKAASAVGTCIDTFHKNPAHQRKLLDDPNNLPYQTDIDIGHLKFALNVTAIKDADGNYVGNALEWADVTEQRAKDTEVARLQSAVDGAQANLMICDTDLEITYANPSVVKTVNLNVLCLMRLPKPLFKTPLHLRPN